MWIIHVILRLVFVMLCARLFIDTLWSPAGKGLTSWLLFVMSGVQGGGGMTLETNRYDTKFNFS